MNRPGSLLWFDRPVLVALALTAVMYVVTVLVGGVQGEYIPQPAVLAIVLGALLARWRLGLGWSMAIIGMLITATILFILAEASLYPDGIPTIDQPGGDLTRIGEFRPAFLLHLVAILLATGMATILAFRVANRRSILVIGLVLILAISVVGAITLVSGDWMTYERLVTLPVAPWAFGWPVYALLVFAGLWWAATMAKRVRHQADMAPRADRLPVIKNALLGELVPAFAGAQRSAATTERARFATELHASVLPAIRSVVQSADPSGPASGAEIDACEGDLRRRGADHPSIPLLLTVPQDRPGPGVHDRLRDRRHRTVPEPQEADRVHRAVTTGPSVGQPRRPWAAGQERPQVPALGAHRGRHPRCPRRPLSGALRADQAAPRPAARREGRPGRHRPQARRSHLAHPHQERTLCPGRPRDRSGRLTTPLELGRRNSLPPDLVLLAEGHREMSAARSPQQSAGP